MTKLQNIVLGQTGWDGTINANFAALNQDTGWIAAVVTAPVTGTLSYRLKNNILYVRGYVTPNIAIGSDLLIGKLPTNIFPNIGGIQSSSLWAVPVTGAKVSDTAKIILHNDGGLYIAGDNGIVTQPIVINITFTTD